MRVIAFESIIRYCGYYMAGHYHESRDTKYGS